MILFTLLQSLPEIDTTEIKKAEESAYHTFEHIMSTPMNQLLPEFLDKLVHFGLKVLLALLIYAVGAWCIRLIKNMMRRMFNKKKTDASVASFMTSLVSIALTIVLIVITIGTLGINTTSIAALLAAGGMAIGMALSGTVQNFAGGIMLMVFKPFKAGDYIVVDDYSGTVTSLSIFSTTLTTSDNRSIIIPNGTLSNGVIDNYSSNTMRRVEWLVGVEYGVDAVKVKEALKSILDEDKRILYAKDGAPDDPLIALNDLMDSNVQFVMRAWVKKGDYWGVRFDTNEKIYKELPEKGINFPFPQMDVHLTKN